MKLGRTLHATLLVGCTTVGLACNTDARHEARLRELLLSYMHLQEAHFANVSTYDSSIPAELIIPSDLELQRLGTSRTGHAALAFHVSDPDYVCAARVGDGEWGLGTVAPNGRPTCGQRTMVFRSPPPDSADATTNTERASAAPPPPLPTPPPHARYYPLIASGEDLPLDDPAEHTEIVLAITQALTRPVDSLQPLTVFDEHLQPSASGAGQWSVERLRVRARVLIKRIGDPALLPVLVRALGTTVEGKRQEFQRIQGLLVTLTGTDSAPFYVESTAATRRAAEAFWQNWLESTGSRPFVTEREALRARRRWERTVQRKAWAADPRSWSTLLTLPVVPDLDDTTRSAVGEVVRTLLTEDPVRLAQRMGARPTDVARTRLRAARYVRIAHDTASVSALIDALTVPDPEIFRDVQDSVFLELQETLVIVTAADTAPRYPKGSAANRKAAAAFWRRWWETSRGQVAFPVWHEAQRLQERWKV